MKKWTGTIEVTTVARYICTVTAETQEDAECAFRSFPKGLDSFYPCGCEDNLDKAKLFKVHSVRALHNVDGGVCDDRA